LFGVHLEAARTVTIEYFFLFLMGYLITMGRRYHKDLLFCGVVALSMQGTFFSFRGLRSSRCPSQPWFMVVFFCYANLRTIRWP
jgi:hypothetical protein